MLTPKKLSWYLKISFTIVGLLAAESGLLSSALGAFTKELVPMNKGIFY